MSVPAYTFGPGIAIVTRTDIANGPPVNVGFVNELSIDLTGTIKELYGQNQYALGAARGTIKATGKWKSATISGLAWNNVFFGQSLTTGGIDWNIGELQTIPTTPFAVTVTASTTFDVDLGVTYVATGLPLQQVVGGSEVAGKSYSVVQTGGGKGIYTFAAGDTGLSVRITYSKTVSAAQQTLAVANALIGTTPTFQLDYYTSTNQPTRKPFIVRAFGCISSKIVVMGAKLEDYTMPEFDFGLFADNSGRVISLFYPEVS